MLKSKNRLPGKSRLKTNRDFTTPIFRLKVSQNGLDYNRYGFVVSKKIDKRATIRNSIKRTVRMCIEENLGIIQPGFDMLFIIKPEIINKAKSQQCETILSLLKKENYLL